MIRLENLMKEYDLPGGKRAQVIFADRLNVAELSARPAGAPSPAC